MTTKKIMFVQYDRERSMIFLLRDVVRSYKFTFFSGLLSYFSKFDVMISFPGNLLFSPDYFSFSFGKLFSLLPTAFRMNKIPFSQCLIKNISNSRFQTVYGIFMYVFLLTFDALQITI